MTLVIDTKVCKCLYCDAVILLDSTLTPGMIHDKDCPGRVIEIGYLLTKYDFDKLIKDSYDSKVKSISYYNLE